MTHNLRIYQPTFDRLANLKHSDFCPCWVCFVKGPSWAKTGYVLKLAQAQDMIDSGDADDAQEFLDLAIRLSDWSVESILGLGLTIIDSHRYKEWDILQRLQAAADRFDE